MEGKKAAKPANTFESLRFINISNPAETKSRSKKREVRSHIATRQHRSNRERPGKSSAKTFTSGHNEVLIKQEEKETYDTASSASLTSPTFSTSSASPRLAVFRVSNNREQDGATSEAMSLEQVSRLGSSFLSRDTHGMREDPFHSYPVPWKETYTTAFDFYVTTICQDTPQLLPETGEVYMIRFRSLWLPFIMQSPRAFYASVAVGASYCYSYKQPLPKSVLVELTLHAIAAINQVLLDPKQSIDDHTIGAVCMLAGLESLYGDTKSYKAHMTGLSRMVRMRGGLQNLALDGLLSRLILWLDHGHAENHGSIPFFKDGSADSRHINRFDYGEIIQQAPIQLDLPEREELSEVAGIYEQAQEAGMILLDVR